MEGSKFTHVNVYGIRQFVDSLFIKASDEIYVYAPLANLSNKKKTQLI